MARMARVLSMTIFKKIKNFAVSLFKHTAKGMPKASQFTINTRFQICYGCDSFDTKNLPLMECSECGCSISKKKEFMNKLAWGDQKCPLGKW